MSVLHHLPDTASLPDELDPEESRFREQCRRFAEAVIAPACRRYDEQNCFPAAVHEEAYRQGLMNNAIPAELGGGGLSMRALLAGGEALATACAPTAFTMGFNHGALRPILHGGTPAQTQRFVHELMLERRYASLCLTEEEVSGTNLMALQTTATRIGSTWRVRGRKCMVGNGTEASLYVVLASAVVGGQAEGLTFFAVPRGAGVTVSENTDKLGFRCVPTPTVVFDDVEVSDEHVIGPVGGAEPLLLHTLDYMRVGGSAVMLGLTCGALRDGLTWLKEREVHGGRLLDKSHVRIALGEIYARLLSVRLVARRAAALLDRGLPCSRESAAAKLLASELAVHTTGVIVQMFGWRGIDNRFPIQKRFRDARQTTIFEGTSELQSLNLFGALVRELAP